MTELNGTTFLSGANAEFIAELYSRYLQDPAAGDESWRRFFAEFGDDAAASRAEQAGPPWSRPLPPLLAPETPAPGGPATDRTAVQQAAFDSIPALNLIRSYRVRGHLEADLDPLRLEQRRPHNELDYHTWGFTEGDLDREIFINTLGRERATLREIIAILRETYCGRIGIEYMHIQVLAERQWIQQKFEHLHDRPQLTTAAKKEVLRVLTATETFERFL